MQSLIQLSQPLFVTKEGFVTEKEEPHSIALYFRLLAQGEEFEAGYCDSGACIIKVTFTSHRIEEAFEALLKLRKAKLQLGEKGMEFKI